MSRFAHPAVRLACRLALAWPPGHDDPARSPRMPVRALGRV